MFSRILTIRPAALCTEVASVILHHVITTILQGLCKSMKHFMALNASVYELCEKSRYGEWNGGK